MTNTKEINLLSKINSAVTREDWNELSELLNPKFFTRIELEDLIAFPIVAKVAQILTTGDSTIPDNIKIRSLKCLGNSCFNGYRHKEYILNDSKYSEHYDKLYSSLAVSYKGSAEWQEFDHSYPHGTHFPYEGIAKWTSDYIISHDLNVEQSSDEQLEILRLCIQFLCNLFTFACKDNNFPNQCNTPKCLNDTKLKATIVNLTQCENVLLIRASCIFIHNALKELQADYFTQAEKENLCSQLLCPIEKGFESAKDALSFLLKDSDVFQRVYKNMAIENRLHLLEIIYNEASKSVYDGSKETILDTFTVDMIEFLSEQFCKKSDVILKTVDTYLNDIEPREIIILLDILGVLTCTSSKETHNPLKDNKSLLINCIYLLKSIHMVGKESSNYFTPMQKLSDVAPAIQGITINNQITNPCTTKNESNKNGTNTEEIKNDIYSHPAFGFKAGLIRIIGNMVYNNKPCQDILRDSDVIPLLLDCCNIDARNPLIMQWTIFALRNVCEDNQENQEIIRNCTKVGVVENSALKEMGLTLHEDEEGKKIGIVPLVREQK